MLIILFIFSIAFLLKSILVILPTVILPSFVISLLTTAVGTYNSFLDIFPYATLPTAIFLNIILPFEISLLIAKFFLGSRVPSRSE